MWTILRGVLPLGTGRLVFGFGFGNDKAYGVISGNGQSPKKFVHRILEVYDPTFTPRRSCARIGPSSLMAPAQTSASSAWILVNTLLHVSIMRNEEIQTLIKMQSCVKTFTKKSSPSPATPFNTTRVACTWISTGLMRKKDGHTSHPPQVVALLSLSSTPAAIVVNQSLLSTADISTLLTSLVTVDPVAINWKPSKETRKKKLVNLMLNSS